LGVIALSAMVAYLSMTAQAADSILTLACQGSMAEGNADPEPTSMGIIVNFTPGLSPASRFRVQTFR